MTLFATLLANYGVSRHLLQTQGTMLIFLHTAEYQNGLGTLNPKASQEPEFIQEGISS